MVDVFNAAGYVYVENLTWVLLAPTNKARAAWARSPPAPHVSAPAQMLAGPTAHIGRSHRTLLIFRRDVRTHPKGKEIELRHQRSPDVDVSIVRTGKGATRLRAWAVNTADSPPDGRIISPEAAYIAIETLLPGAYTPGQPGRFLELWGHTEVRRPGWTHVAPP